MGLKQQLTTELKNLAGQGAQVVHVTADGADVSIDVASADSMSCAVREIRLHVPSLHSAAGDVLKTWADALCQRINYLLENLGPLEFDADASQALIRSVPPHKSDDGRYYYEVMLATQSAGNFSLKRYKTDPQAGREQIDLHTTHELLIRLVEDLVDTIPE